MSESAITDAGEKDPRHEKGRGFFGRIALFVRQVVSELKRVVTPTGRETYRYTVIVLVFVLVVMVFVSALDIGFGRLVGLVFG